MVGFLHRNKKGVLKLSCVNVRMKIEKPNANKLKNTNGDKIKNGDKFQEGPGLVDVVLLVAV